MCSNGHAPVLQTSMTSVGTRFKSGTCPGRAGDAVGRSECPAAIDGMAIAAARTAAARVCRRIEGISLFARVVEGRFLLGRPLPCWRRYRVEVWREFLQVADVI